MDPTILAAIMGALAALATEVVKGTASEAGKDAWAHIKRLLGAEPQAALDRAQGEVARALEVNPKIVPELLDLLNKSQSVHVQQLVGSVDAKKAVIAGKIDGDIHM